MLPSKLQRQRHHSSSRQGSRTGSPLGTVYCPIRVAPPTPLPGHIPLYRQPNYALTALGAMMIHACRVTEWVHRRASLHPQICDW
ncbi:hypothetical protein F4801DRAFT_556959 [Xylaria longipes]|nr:hypothetical protein F4801DRAFT_556959 [Xylaria longipes]